MSLLKVNFLIVNGCACTRGHHPFRFVRAHVTCTIFSDGSVLVLRAHGRVSSSACCAINHVKSDVRRNSVSQPMPCDRGSSLQYDCSHLDIVRKSYQGSCEIYVCGSFQQQMASSTSPGGIPLERDRATVRMWLFPKAGHRQIITQVRRVLKQVRAALSPITSVLRVTMHASLPRRPLTYPRNDSLQMNAT